LSIILDGTEPTTSSMKYTGTVELSQTQTIKAIAVKDGMLDSSVSTATYTKEIEEAPSSGAEKDDDEDVEDTDDDDTDDEDTGDEGEKDKVPDTGDARTDCIWLIMLSALVALVCVSAYEKRAKKKL